MKEIWKDIKGYDGLYQVSNLGNIKRLKDNYIFKVNKNSRGYRVVTLTKNKKEKSITVHRLVAQAFIDNPYNFSQINHIDGNKLNNKIDNLEWCTASQNMQHAYKNGLELKKHKKVVQFDLNMKIIKIWESVLEVEKNLKINHSKIYMVCNKQRNKAGGYIWRYYE